MDITHLSEDEQEELIQLLQERDTYIKYNRVEQFRPYEFQKKFYKAGTGVKRRMLCAGNRIGKSYSEAVEVSYHLTGLYPDWWEGHKFDYPILCWAVGITGDSTQKVLQKELFGTPLAKDVTEIGTGSIPKSAIIFDYLVRDGHQIKFCKIEHSTNGIVDGESIIEFRSTAQGEHTLMGATVDYIWLDEEDAFRSSEIYAQCVTRTATTGGHVVITATPENGMTALIKQFMSDSEFLYFQNATWDDAPHLTESVKEELLASIPAFQHDMRKNGIPIMGEGLIYSIDERDIMIDPINIPEHWKRVCGIDIGSTHPTVAVWSAYDASSDIIYVYDIYKKTDAVPMTHAISIKLRGDYIPVILPHDAINTERGSGRNVADYYAEAGVNVAHDTFHNKMTSDGKTNNFVGVGLIEINTRMHSGRLKVFSTCTHIFEEMRQYHRKDGKIVKKFDDALDAMRYSVLSVVDRGISASEGGNGYSSGHTDNWSSFNNNY